MTSDISRPSFIPCGSAAAGYQIPLTFQMDEWEHEWMEEDKRRVTRHLKVAIEAVRVCQYAVWTGDQEQLEETLKWQKSSGTNWLSVGTG